MKLSPLKIEIKKFVRVKKNSVFGLIIFISYRPLLRFWRKSISILPRGSLSTPKMALMWLVVILFKNVPWLLNHASKLSLLALTVLLRDLFMGSYHPFPRYVVFLP